MSLMQPEIPERNSAVSSGTSLATPSDLGPRSTRPGSPGTMGPSFISPEPSTRRGRSTDSPPSPTPWRRPAVPTRISSSTAASRVTTSGDVGPLTSCLGSDKGEQAEETLMTEAEWLSCSDPAPMLEWLQGSGKASERKLRVFAVACVRRHLGQIEDERSRSAVEAAERYSDGLIGLEDLSESGRSAYRAVLDTLHFSGDPVPSRYDFCNYADAAAMDDATRAARSVARMG